MPLEDPKKHGQLDTLERPKLDRPKLYEVLLHNDDYTTRELVVLVLMKFFHHDETTAQQIMLHVHNQGMGVAGIFPYDLAETKAHLVTAFARKHEMPLQCSLREQGRD